MSGDRELLEVAAKAAGLRIGAWAEADFYSHRTGYVNILIGGDEWNPLTDDGDALRLAIALGFIIDVRHKGAPDYRRFNRVCYWLPMSETEHHRHIAVDEIGDLDAAVRRAIVSAAAEIGKAMS